MAIYLGDKYKNYIVHAGSYLIVEAEWSVGSSEASNHGPDPLALGRSLPYSIYPSIVIKVQT